jgi:glycerophosphoryl diester phosphodiesterase
MAKRDRLRVSLEERRERFVFESLLRLAEELNDRKPDDKKSSDDKKDNEEQSAAKPTPAAPPAVRIAPAQDDADYIAAVMLARLIDPERYQALLLPKELLAAELVERAAELGGEALVISAVPPSAAANAAYLCKRLRSRLPQQKIVVALWHAEGNVERIKQRLLDAGADEVVTRIPDALERLRNQKAK